jgi:hypothetical protein
LTVFVTEDQADHLIAQMKGAFDGAIVPEEAICELEPAMGNDPKDRHVLAAAKAIGAEAVVTFNLKDFPDDACEPLGIEAQHPDEFLMTLFNINPDGVVGVLRQQASDLEAPPMTFDELLEILKKTVPGFVDALLGHCAREPD